MTADELLRKAFWRKVDNTTNPQGCWLWTGKLRLHGYGVMNIGHKSIKAHRLSWIVNNGDLPSDLLVCHRCDTPNCVRPDHLFLGTCADNVADMVRKGRQSRIAKNKTPDSVRQLIVDLRNAGMALRDIAQQVNLHELTVGKICKKSTLCTRPSTRFGPREVACIRRAYEQGYKKSEIAEAIGCSATAVNKVVSGAKCYAHMVPETISEHSVDLENLLKKLAKVRQAHRLHLGIRTPEQISQVRQLVEQGASYYEISSAMGIPYHAVWRIATGRGCYGQSMPQGCTRPPKLCRRRTLEEAQQVRDMASGGATYDEISRSFRMSVTTIWNILKRRGKYGDIAATGEDSDL